MIQMIASAPCFHPIPNATSEIGRSNIMMYVHTIPQY